MGLVVRGYIIIEHAGSQGENLVLYLIQFIHFFAVIFYLAVMCHYLVLALEICPKIGNFT